VRTLLQSICIGLASMTLVVWVLAELDSGELGRVERHLLDGV